VVALAILVIIALIAILATFATTTAFATFSHSVILYKEEYNKKLI
jgi:hypothetical protein